MAKEVVRRSRAQALLQCVDHEREDGERLAFGSAWHDFAAGYTLECLAKNEETLLSEVDRIAATSWARTPGLAPGRWQEYLDLCNRFAETHPAGLAALVGVEQTLVHDVGFAIVQCTVDRIDRLDSGDPDEPATEELLTDYKTEVAEMDHGFQIRWYAQVRFLSAPAVRRIHFIIDWPRYGGMSRDVVFDRGDLDHWWSTTMEALERRLDGPKGQRVGGVECEGCRLRYDCPKAIAVAAALPENDDQADELLGEAVRMQEGAKVRMQAIESYYADREPRVVNGFEVGFLQPREEGLQLTANWRQQVKWALSHKLDLDKLFRISGSKLNKGLARDLVDKGLAGWQLGAPAFKTRKALESLKSKKAS